MDATETIVIGAGQAGLAMSRCLTERHREHVVLERGRVAERWRSERWESLRLLTPYWMSRLPGWRYGGPDVDSSSALVPLDLGQRFQHRRNSSFIDGVGHDAWAITDHIARRDRLAAPAGCGH